MGAAFSAVQIGIHNAKVNTALARGVKNPGVKLNYWTGEPVQPGRSAWSFSNAKPNYVKARIEIGNVEFLGTPVDDVADDVVLRGTTEFPDLLNVGDKGNIIEFTKHGFDQSISRGFKGRDILKIMREGKTIQSIGRYGPQTKYILGGNTVIIDNASSKVITVFSNDIKNNGYLIPFK